MSLKYVPPRKRFFTGDKKSVSFRFPSDLVNFYEKLAKETGVTITELVIDVLDQTAEQMQTAEKKRNR